MTKQFRLNWLQSLLFIGGGLWLILLTAMAIANFVYTEFIEVEHLGHTHEPVPHVHHNLEEAPPGFEGVFCVPPGD